MGLCFKFCAPIVVISVVVCHRYLARVDWEILDKRSSGNMSTCRYVVFEELLLYNVPVIYGIFVNAVTIQCQVTCFMSALIVSCVWCMHGVVHLDEMDVLNGTLGVSVVTFG